jgi:hypothetical protein
MHHSPSLVTCLYIYCATILGKVTVLRCSPPFCTSNIILRCRGIVDWMLSNRGSCLLGSSSSSCSSLPVHLNHVLVPATTTISSSLAQHKKSVPQTRRGSQDSLVCHARRKTTSSKPPKEENPDDESKVYIAYSREPKHALLPCVNGLCARGFHCPCKLQPCRRML